MSPLINFDPELIRTLLPSTPLFPKKSIWDSLPRNNISPLVNNLLPTIHKINMSWMQLRLAFFHGVQLEALEKTENENARYLEYPNNEIKNLATTIVNPEDDYDTIALKMCVWVQENIKYISDLKNYGVSEWWTTPTFTLNRESGDCEDGAFLIHSLMLNAGVPWERIRTYGGEVMGGGHGWTAYNRELDDTWVILDWCYWPNQDLIADRLPMSEDYRYIDDWFYINSYATVDTPYANKVRDPAMAYDWAKTKKYVVGQRVSIAA